MLPASWTPIYSRLLPPHRPLLRIARVVLASHELLPRGTNPRPHHPSFTRPFSNTAGPSSVRPDHATEPDSKSKSPLAATEESIDQLIMFVEEEMYDEADHLLSQLLEEGYTVPPNPIYEHAIINVLQRPADHQRLETFSDWLSVLPDARDATPGAFQHMLELLSESPHDKLSLITHFGTVGASKGYMPLVEKGVVPLVSRIADISSLVRFTSNVYTAAKRYREKPPEATSANTQVEQSAVFEDLSEEYAAVSSQSTPLPPATIELVESTLPETLSEPSPDDSLVFEDPSSLDYVVQSTPQSLPQKSTDVLYRLVRTEQYDEAYLLLQELIETNTHIPESTYYEAAACAELKMFMFYSKTDQRIPPEEYLERFYTWLHLLPPRHETNFRNPYEDVTELVLRTGRTDAAIRFSLILAEKGYGDGISTATFPFLVRMELPQTVYWFLEKFESLNRHYWTETNPEEHMLGSTNTYIRSKAIYALAHAGRLDEALHFIPKPDSGIKVSEHTYNILVRNLAASKDPKKLAQIASVETIRGDKKYTVSALHKAKVEHIYQSEESKEVELDRLSRVDDYRVPHDLVAHIRYLKRMIANRRPLPNVVEVTNFIEDYLATGRTFALTLLLNKAFRTDKSTASYLLFAEMMYYYRKRRHHLVISTFVDHYYMIGIPRSEVLMCYKRQDSYENDDEDQMKGRYHQLSGIPIRSRGKLWPLPNHCTLVWHSIASVTSSIERLDEIYTKLVSAARYEQSRSPIDITKEHPLGWKRPIDETAFTPFMRRLMTEYGPARGSRVLNDIVSVGLTPTVYHFTELASFYAHHGDARRALMILDRIERSQSSESSSNLFPALDVALYNAILRGFIYTENLKDAEEIERRRDASNLPRTEEEQQHVNELSINLEHLRERTRHENNKHTAFHGI